MGKILLAQTSRCPSPTAPILFSRLQPPPHLWDPAQRLAGGQAFPGSSWGALNAGGVCVGGCPAPTQRQAASEAAAQQRWMVGGRNGHLSKEKC